MKHNGTTPSTRHADVLICGGGISGLALAAWLDQAGIHAHVLDKNAQPGGVIGSLRLGDFLFERGPSTVLDKHASMDDLIAWAGLEAEAIRVPLRSQPRHVWLRGRLREVPTGPGAFLRSPLLPLTAKLALLREPFVKRRDDDESVADFVRRRLGQAWLRNLIGPMVGGIWAGNPERLSIEHAFPIMKQLERDGGSLLRGALRRRAAERKAGAAPPRVKSMLSFKDGLQSLPRALAARLADRYHPRTSVETVSPLEGGGFTVRARRDGDPVAWTARHVVVAADGAPAADWVRAMDSGLAALLESFPYNRLIVISLGIERASATLPAGFGFLVPRGEELRILGAIVPSNFLPGRAPDGCAALSVFIGGELDDTAFDLADDEIEGVLCRNLRRAIGWDGRARAIHIERWPRAIPQYDLRHAARLRQIAQAEARWPGLHLAGNWRGGVGVPDRVEFARRLSETIAGSLRASDAAIPERTAHATAFARGAA